MQRSPTWVHRMLRAQKALAAVAVMTISTTAAQAAGPEPLPGTISEPAPINRWEVILGAGALYAPEYEGSDEFEAVPVPLVLLRYGRVQVGPDRIGYRVYGADRLSFDLSVGYGGERKPADIDSGYLDGFEKIDASAILSARGGYAFGDAEVYLELDQYLGGTDGLSATLGVDFERQIERLTFSAGASVTVSDDDYMQGYFGVTPEQAAASARGYQPYSAGAGLRRIDLSVGAAYAVTENWQVRGEVGVGTLLGDAQDSPLVFDEVQPNASLFVAYRF